MNMWRKNCWLILSILVEFIEMKTFLVQTGNLKNTSFNSYHKSKEEFGMDLTDDYYYADVSLLVSELLYKLHCLSICVSVYVCVCVY